MNLTTCFEVHYYTPRSMDSSSSFQCSLGPKNCFFHTRMFASKHWLLFRLNSTCRMWIFEFFLIIPLQNWIILLSNLMKYYFQFWFVHFNFYHSFIICSHIQLFPRNSVIFPTTLQFLAWLFVMFHLLLEFRQVMPFSEQCFQTGF